MKENLSKSDVLDLLIIWDKWIKGPDPKNNKPDELKWWDENYGNVFVFSFGLLLHIFLWILTRISLFFSILPLAVWSSKCRIKYDYLWWEPVSCGLNNSYSDLGLAFLKSQQIQESINCLNSSWKVYPCPHNTTFGLKLKLCKALKKYTGAKDAVDEYIEMRDKFKSV